jgi:hypothetical protein
MQHDFDNLIEMRFAEYDRERAEELLKALIDLCLDAGAQEDPQAEALASRGDSAKSLETCLTARNPVVD